MGDKFEDLVDAGWQALDEGSIEDARRHVEAATRLEPESAEALTLLGAIYAQEGDHVSAMVSFKKAIKADPEHFDAAHLGAQLAGADGDLEEALRLIEIGLDAADEEDEYLASLLLKAEIELGLEDDDAAAKTLAELPPVDLPAPEFHLRAAESYVELEDFDGAEKHLQAALRLDPKCAEAHHGLGIVAERRGDEAAMVAEWKKVRALDAAAPAPPYTITDDELEKVVEAAMSELPERARTLLANVPIVIELLPSDELIDDGLDPRMYGLFTGTPYPEQATVGGAAVHLEHILLFKRNLERDAHSTEELQDEIRTTLLHETGHFFGMDEDDLEEVGLD